MNSTDQLAALAVECRRMGDAPVDFLDTPVPSMPGFTIEKLLRHVTSVHRIAIAVLAAPDGTEMSSILAGLTKSGKGPQAVVDYRESAELMLSAYAERDSARRVATWGGPDSPDYWVRRQLHEVTVHRFDAHDALCAADERSEPDAAEPAAAADGVVEWAETFLPRFPVDAMPKMRGRTVHLHTTDGTETELFLDFGADDVDVSRKHARGDVALRGRAEDLLLAVWRRRSIDALDVVGDRVVAEDLVDSVRI